jgi:hypothetical protein
VYLLKRRKFAAAFRRSPSFLKRTLALARDLKFQ